MAAEKNSPARVELLRIARKHQKRVMALGLRFQTTPSLSLLPSSASTAIAATSNLPRTPTNLVPDASRSAFPEPSFSTSHSPYPSAPKQLQLTHDALGDLIHRLERDPGNNGPTLIMPEDLERLKTCGQAFLTAAYSCLYMATKMSCVSEESSWVGSGLAKSIGGTNKSSFVERDWANGRLYYEAHYIFRLGLEDMIDFMKTDPAMLALVASFEQSMRDLKLEGDVHVK